MEITPGSSSLAVYTFQCPTAKPMVVGAGAVRMSVPIVPAQNIKQVTSADTLLKKYICNNVPCIVFINCTPCRWHLNPWRRQQWSVPRPSSASSCRRPLSPRSSPTSPTSRQPSWHQLQEGGTWAMQLCQHSMSRRLVVISWLLFFCFCFLVPPSPELLYMYVFHLFSVVNHIFCSCHNHHLWHPPAAPISQHLLLSRRRPGCHSMGNEKR